MLLKILTLIFTICICIYAFFSLSPIRTAKKDSSILIISLNPKIMNYLLILSSVIVFISLFFRPINKYYIFFFIFNSLQVFIVPILVIHRIIHSTVFLKQNSIIISLTKELTFDSIEDLEIITNYNGFTLEILLHDKTKFRTQGKDEFAINTLYQSITKSVLSS